MIISSLQLIWLILGWLIAHAALYTMSFKLWLVVPLTRPLSSSHNAHGECRGWWEGLFNKERKTLGAFHSTKTWMRQHFQNFQREETSWGIPKFSQIFSRKSSSHSTLLPEFLEFSVELFAFQKFNSFWSFWKLFREISVPFAAVSKFSKVLVA